MNFIGGDELNDSHFPNNCPIRMSKTGYYDKGRQTLNFRGILKT